MALHYLGSESGQDLCDRWTGGLRGYAGTVHEIAEDASPYWHVSVEPGSIAPQWVEPPPVPQELHEIQAACNDIRKQMLRQFVGLPTNTPEEGSMNTNFIHLDEAECCQSNPETVEEWAKRTRKEAKRAAKRAKQAAKRAKAERKAAKRAKALANQRREDRARALATFREIASGFANGKPVHPSDRILAAEKLLSATYDEV